MNDRKQKRAIRGDVIRRILAMGQSDRDRQEAALGLAFTHLPGLRSARTVLLYVNAFPEEFSTFGMLRFTQQEGKVVVCPRVSSNGSFLELFAVDDLATDFELGRLGIPEPRRSCPAIAASAIDWALVPGIAFDARGFRIGRGAGHYDRLLPQLRDDAPRWALAFDEQWIAAVPNEPHDQPLDGIASASRRCERGANPIAWGSPHPHDRP